MTHTSLLPLYCLLVHRTRVILIHVDWAAWLLIDVKISTVAHVSCISLKYQCWLIISGILCKRKMRRLCPWCSQSHGLGCQSEHSDLIKIKISRICVDWFKLAAFYWRYYGDVTIKKCVCEMLMPSWRQQSPITAIFSKSCILPHPTQGIRCHWGVSNT